VLFDGVEGEVELKRISEIRPIGTATQLVLFLADLNFELPRRYGIILQEVKYASFINNAERHLHRLLNRDPEINNLPQSTFCIITRKIFAAAFFIANLC